MKPSLPVVPQSVAATTGSLSRKMRCPIGQAMAFFVHDRSQTGDQARRNHAARAAAYNTIGQYGILLSLD
ncbi:hypothetical protein [Thalassovita mangrovi]|uniref:hypothetical protein n=1 Tax=Thalassovita mangrovi TaxID=2692236 RepID=UPI00136CC975|nr:hypothetical protein [Thalassovita mangrovi]